MCSRRFGSAARGDRIYQAGHALGQLLRTVYLCDYFALPDFRRPLYRVLERGESVHALQRQICSSQVLKNARSSSFTRSFKVVHIPCGAPLYTTSLAFLTIVADNSAESAIGTIWSSSP